MTIDWTQLSAPFAPDDVEWKPGATTRDKKKGLAMAYITARAVQERLDEVFTPGGWKNEFRAGPDGGVICRIYFKTGEVDEAGAAEWAWREDGADNTDVEAVKGGLSNAMKRTGAALGIGRYLYKLPSQWVPLDERGRFAQTPRIPREYLPGNGRASGGSPSQGNAQQNAAPRASAPRQSAPQRDASGGSRPQESRETQSRPQRPAPAARPERPQQGPASGDARGGSRDESRSGNRPQAGQKQVIRRVGGQNRPDARGRAGGDGASRPAQPPRPF